MIKKENYIEKYSRLLNEDINNENNSLENQNPTDNNLPSNDNNLDMGNETDNNNNDNDMPDLGGNFEADDFNGGNEEETSQEGVDGFNPQGNNDEELDFADNNDNDDDVEEIEVDDLVDSQDETKAKINKLIHAFSKSAKQMMKMTDNISSKIDATVERLNKLEDEMKKRNPTPVERMTLRSSEAYPFNVSPDSFWKEKEHNSNYSPESDNNGADDERYQITKGDLDDITDYQAISNTLRQKQNLHDIFNW